MATPSKPNSVQPIGEGDHLYLIDGSGYIFRAYHALPPLTRKSDGMPVGAVSGFSSMLHKLVEELKGGDRPTHLAVIFDHSGKSFRNDIYPEYKAHRPPAPEDLVPQFAMVREATRAFGLPSIEMEGFEADDLIATYARQARDAGAHVTIVSSDKDLMQMVDEGCDLLDTMKNRRQGPEEVVEKFGVGPEKVIEVQALSGDSVDNVPGVPGIGGKSAGPIIREVGGLDALIGPDAEPDEIKAKLQKTFDQLQSDIDAAAGEPLKLGAGGPIARILLETFGITEAQLGKDKSGKPSADTKSLEAIAASGNVFVQNILRARMLKKMVGSQIDTIVANADKAAVSRELVTLKQDVDVDVPVGNFGLHEPDPKVLIPYLKSMEFKTLVRRVAADFDIEDVDAITAEGSSSLAAPSRETPATSSNDAPSTSAPMSPAEAGGSPGAVMDRGALVKAIDPDSYETINTMAALEDWIARATEAGTVCVDTETTSLDTMVARLVGISLAIVPGEACYIPFGHGSGDGLSFEDVPEQIDLRLALEKLKPLLEDPSVLKIAQNVKYDFEILARQGIRLFPFDDTMLISYALDAGLHGHGMDALSKEHLGHTPIPFSEIAGKGKAQKTFDEIPVDEATRYAAEDADVTLRLHKLLKPRLPADGLTTVYETLERPLIPILADMEMAGVKVDRQVLSRLSGDFAQRMMALEAEAHDLAGESFNLGSPKQLGEIMFEKLGLPAGKKTKTGAYATGADVLEGLAAEGHDLPKVLLTWRQLSKLKGTYTDALPEFINAETGRVHTSYSLAATTTGRLASSDPNLQNIPIRTPEGRLIRTAFIADKGNKLISADYSQIELRVLAHAADIPELRKAFEDGLDIHAMTASEMFGVPIEGMDPSVRRRAKAINFGIIYGISAFGLANQLGISRGEAQDYIKTYFERVPGIRDYMNSTIEDCRREGYVETIFGRRCHYPNINSKNPAQRSFNERAAINAPIQGSAADIIRRAMIRMPDALNAAKLDATMLLQVHDELIFETPAAQVEDTITIAKQIMENATDPALVLSVPLIVDANSGDTWDEAH